MKKIAVGGMIASGKSTLVKSLAKELNWDYLAEFREDDEVFNTMLKWLYEGKNIELQLQTYFIEKHFQATRNLDKDIIVDRDIIEHWLFAQINLKDKDPQLMMFYNNLFHAFYLEHKKPDLYIILDLDWETFEERLFKRNRKVEIDNFESNKQYFKDLLDDYVYKLEAMCEIYDVPYARLQANQSQKDILEEALSYIRD